METFKIWCIKVLNPGDFSCNRTIACVEYPFPVDYKEVEYDFKRDRLPREANGDLPFEKGMLIISEEEINGDI